MEAEAEEGAISAGGEAPSEQLVDFWEGEDSSQSITVDFHKFEGD
jgi:hypothetical protein